jgi:hypothetical protein
MAPTLLPRSHDVIEALIADGNDLGIPGVHKVRILAQLLSALEALFTWVALSD